MSPPTRRGLFAAAIREQRAIRDVHFEVDGRCGFCWRVGIRPAVWPCGPWVAARETIAMLGGDPDSVDDEKPPPGPREAGPGGG